LISHNFPSLWNEPFQLLPEHLDIRSASKEWPVNMNHAIFPNSTRNLVCHACLIELETVRLK